jgi:hypothetical protein
MSITADGETINYSQAIGFGSLLTNSKYCVPTTGETDVLACGNYTSPSGAYIWTESGDFVDVVQTSSGCDSTVVVHLTIQEIEAAILQDDETQNTNGLIAETTFPLFQAPMNNFLHQAFLEPMLSK